MKRLCFLAAALFATPVAAQVALPLYGINLSGGEFKGVESGALIPKPSEVQAYYDVGFRLIRLPIKASQFIDPKRSATALPKIRAAVQKAIDLGIPIIIDRHEYKWPAVDEQIAFWIKVRDSLPANDLIQFDLMNEPKFPKGELDSRQVWARDSRLIVHGLRAAGVTNFIWLEYPGYSGIDRFKANVPEKSTRACLSAACGLRRQGNINDPLNKTGVQAHRYFDKGGSGTSAYCDKGKKSSHFTNFARQVGEFGMPAMVGESAFGRTGGCDAIAGATLAEMKAGIPNLYGVTWWGGGRGWGAKYIYSTPPTQTPYTLRLTGK